MSGEANREQLRKRIMAATGREPADVVIRNGRIVDVFGLEAIRGDVAIRDGVIVGIGSYEGKTVIDAQGRYVCPGLIDGHVHIESSMATPAEFAKVVLPHGVTTVVADPHEIANVCGTAGLDYMLDASRGLPLNVLFMLPSCVPATPFENAGAELAAPDLSPYYGRPGVLGLAEVMDYPAVAEAREDMLDKLADAAGRGVPVDGHGSGLGPGAIDVYRAAGIRTDHECTTPEEALDRVRRGMYVLMREGSAAKNLAALLPAVNAGNERRFAFCTDDKHLDELVAEGSIDHHIRLAIRHGMDPLRAIRIATLNAAECFGLQGLGAVAPGYAADLLIVDDLENMTIRQVYRAGELVAEDGRVVAGSRAEASRPVPPALTGTVRLPRLREEDLRIAVGPSGNVRVIEVIPNSIVTRKRIVEADAVDGVFKASTPRDLLKMAVIERHRGTGNVGLGIVSGFRLRRGAIASTVAHDSHNLVCVGATDRDMLAAVDALGRMGGGLVVVDDGEPIASLPLEIAGLMTARPYGDIVREIEALNRALTRIGASEEFNAFLTLSFLCLPVIPELKLTDLGLFDTEAFRHVPTGLD
ncbi:adenine deaminase [Cohnella massiliensis]|uniref:adenine deaminase n=1 Tax=Cohnella massiliensis TaxID=1816691 RepID=UPI0009BB9086|nr:adenine deaminase [Cohnella massiliensis]